MTRNAIQKTTLTPRIGEVAAGVSLWRRIADQIEQSIARGTYLPGSRLPGEIEIAARFGVNRHTVRRAIAALAERGLVRAERGSGTFIEQRRIPYPIKPRTRFSEIVGGAGYTVSGRLMASAVESADAEIAKRLKLKPARRCCGWNCCATPTGFRSAPRRRGSTRSASPTPRVSTRQATRPRGCWRASASVTTHGKARTCSHYCGSGRRHAVAHRGRPPVADRRQCRHRRRRNSDPDESGALCRRPAGTGDRNLALRPATKYWPPSGSHPSHASSGRKTASIAERTGNMRRLGVRSRLPTRIETASARSAAPVGVERQCSRGTCHRIVGLCSKTNNRPPGRSRSRQ